MALGMDVGLGPAKFR